MRMCTRVRHTMVPETIKTLQKLSSRLIQLLKPSLVILVYLIDIDCGF